MKVKILFSALAVASAALLAGCANQNLDPSSLNKNLSLGTASSKDLRLAKSQLLLVPVGTTNFAVLAGTTVTNDGLSVITGDLGVSPGTAITGFQPTPINSIAGPGTVTAGLGVVIGTIYASGPVAAQAHNDAVIAYNYLVAQAPDTTYAGVTQLNGMTFTPGIYKFAPSANLQVNGTVYLDFQGNNNALFIFQLGSTLVTMAGSNVIALNNNNEACSGSNVFWAVGSSATINGSQFIGAVIATTTITMTSASSVEGRIWALNGAVTMIDNTISACGSSTGGTVPPPKPCGNFVTGGGWINGPRDKATFGVSGGIKNNKFWGELSYDDHKNDVKVKSTSVTAYIVIDATTRQIEGVAKVNGHSSVTYKVIVVDNGEPSANDSFSIQLSNGYHASGKLRGGNIKIHNKCHDSNGKDNDDDDDNGNGGHDRNDHR